jgi:S-adenosylmethionine hydrolase
LSRVITFSTKCNFDYLFKVIQKNQKIPTFNNQKIAPGSMAIITLTSDFGESDHYIGALKGTILSQIPTQVIVDISHQIRHFDLAHGAFVLRSAFPSYPAGTIHIAAVDTVGNRESNLLAVKLEDHYFLLADHGMLGLLSDQEPQKAVELPLPDKPSAFPAMEVLAPVALELAKGTSIDKLGKEVSHYKRMVGRQMRVIKDQIIGHVIRVDHYGNLITNIKQDEFCRHSQGKSYNISIGREQFSRINGSIAETGSGDCFVIFNSLGLLEFGINKGHASELMGLKFDSPVRITFE